jgi:type II secretory pathway pseudopilin PulG
MEVMIALAIIGVGLGSGVLAMSTAVGWVKETRNRQFALHTVRDHMENLRMTGFAGLGTGSQTYTNVSNHISSFTTAYTVTLNTNTNLKDLAVNISWPSTTDNAKTNSLQLSTKVSSALN